MPSPIPTLPTETTRWPSVLLIWAAGFGAAAQFAKISVSFAALQGHYAAQPAGIGLLVGSLGLVGLITGVSAGLFVSRFGAARILVAALLAGALLSLIEASLPPFPAMLALRVLEGFSHILLVIACPTMIVAVAAPRDHRTVMALWAAFFGVGFALTAWAGAPLLARFGAAGVFTAHGLALALLALALTRAGLPRLPRAVGARAGWIASHVAIYRNRHTALPGAIFLWHTISYIALLTLLPGFGPEAGRTALAGILPLSGLVGTFCGMALIRRGTKLGLVAQAGFGGVALLVCAAAFYSETAAYGPLAAALSFCAGLVPAAAFALVPALNATAPSQAQANGALAQLGNLGTFSGTPILALAISVWGFYGLAAVTVLFALVGVLVTRWGMTGQQAA